MRSEIHKSKMGLKSNGVIKINNPNINQVTLHCPAKRSMNKPLSGMNQNYSDIRQLP
jgi:hypothetical protein